MSNSSSFLHRRRLLQAIGASAIGYGANGYFAAPAKAQTSGFRALVCVFLYGGNDGLNMLPPADNDGYARYAAVRKSLALARADIVQLNASHGLHPALTPLKPIWEAGKLAPVFNVGPLARPLTQADYIAWRELNDLTKVPSSLFSHSDQQTLWENGSSDTLLRTGWGGRLLDTVGGSQSVISIAGNTRFGEGNVTKALVLPTPGSNFGLNGLGTSRYDSARQVALEALMAANQNNQINLVQQAFAGSQREALGLSGRLGTVLKQAPTGGSADAANPEISAAFGNLAGVNDNRLSKQLYQVAKLLKHRATVGGTRQIYFVSLGGFDHHANQLPQHAALMTQVGAALASFYQATQAIGLADQVTLFTESDFGRTFKPNGAGGTDHAWGNEHLVMGGAVLGGQSYGTYPSLVLGGPDDAAKDSWEQQGRWIPSTSVDQYGATLGSWLAPEQAATMSSVFPSLAQFSQPTLGFLPVA